MVELRFDGHQIDAGCRTTTFHFRGVAGQLVSLAIDGDVASDFAERCRVYAAPRDEPSGTGLELEINRETMIDGVICSGNPDAGVLKHQPASQTMRTDLSTSAAEVEGWEIAALLETELSRLGG